MEAAKEALAGHINKSTAAAMEVADQAQASAAESVASAKDKFTRAAPTIPWEEHWADIPSIKSTKVVSSSLLVLFSAGLFAAFLVVRRARTTATALSTKADEDELGLPLEEGGNAEE